MKTAALHPRPVLLLLFAGIVGMTLGGGCCTPGTGQTGTARAPAFCFRPAIRSLFERPMAGFNCSGALGTALIGGLDCAMRRSVNAEIFSRLLLGPPTSIERCAEANRNLARSSGIMFIWCVFEIVMPTCSYPYFLLVYGGSIIPITLAHCPTQAVVGGFCILSKTSDQIVSFTACPSRSFILVHIPCDAHHHESTQAHMFILRF